MRMLPAARRRPRRTMRAWSALFLAAITLAPAGAQAPTFTPTFTPTATMTPTEEMACLEEYIDIDISLAGISVNNLGGVPGPCKLSSGGTIDCEDGGPIPPVHGRDDVGRDPYRPHRRKHDRLPAQYEL